MKIREFSSEELPEHGSWPLLVKVKRRTEELAGVRNGDGFGGSGGVAALPDPDFPSILLGFYPFLRLNEERTGLRPLAEQLREQLFQVNWGAANLALNLNIISL